MTKYAIDIFTNEIMSAYELINIFNLIQSNEVILQVD